MLLLIVNNDNNICDLGKHLYIFFIFDTYCKKYNINIIYNNKYINKIFNINKNNNLLFQQNNIYNINNFLINIHDNLLKLNNNNNNNYIIIDVKYSMIYELLNYNLSNDEILDNQKYYYNILLNNKIIYFYELFNKFKINYNEYICIHLYNGDIINDTINYLSFNYFINKYNEILNILQNNTNNLIPDLIIIDYHNTDLNLINKHIKKYDIININNISEIDIFYIMINSKYIIYSNHTLCDYLKKMK